MIGVHFLNNWGYNPDQIFELYRFLTPKHDGVWKNICIEKDFYRAKFFVVLDDYPRTIDLTTIPVKKLIFLQREPIEIKSITIRQECLFYGSYENCYHAAFWRLKKPFKKLLNLKPGKKDRLISSITSGKIKTMGQRKRLDVLYQSARVIPEIEIFGKGLNRDKLGKTYKGELNYDDYCKFEGLYPYRYSFTCENSQHKNYFTEKIVDCFLTWTEPIYWGCPNIGDYFSQEAYTWIDISAKNVLDVFKKTIQDPINYDALNEARRKTLYEYNLLATTQRIIEEYA